MSEISKKPGKLGLAILKDLVESRFGEEYVREQSIPTDGQIFFTEAMQNTADRLWKDWKDKRAWEALFRYLPRNKKLLDELKPAVECFYLHPADTSLAVVLTEIMHDHNQLSPEAVQKAVGEYITTLTEELILSDKNFHENARKSSESRSGEPPSPAKEELTIRQQPATLHDLGTTIPNLGVEEGMLAIEEPITSREGHDIVSDRQVDDEELNAALACISKMPEVKIPRLGSLPRASRFPVIFPDSPFVGRKKELKQLAMWLKKGDTVVITPEADATGEGGIGKTRLAYAFAQRYGRYFAGGVFWLNFLDPDLIPAEVAACGESADGNPLDMRVKQVLSDWQNEMPRLLIFDNCEDPQLVAKWQPPTGGSRVLVTSRQSNWDPGLGFRSLPLGLLNKRESITLLQGFRDDLEANNPDLAAIASDLENMPLALHLAGSFLRTNQSEISPRLYLDRLRQQKLLRPSSISEGESSLNGQDANAEHAFAIVVEWLKHAGETNQLAINLMKRAAFFAPGAFIPLELLGTSAGSDKLSKAAIETEIKKLIEYGLVEVEKAGDLRLHSLVCRFTQEYLPDKRALTQVEQAVLSAAAKANQSGNLTKMQPLLAHLKYLADQALRLRREQSARLANELGYHLEAIADYPGARSYYEKALAFNQRMFGEGHPDTTISLNNLGGLLERMGDYASARPYYEKALVIRRKVLGMEHLDTARSMNNMGHLLQTMEDYTGAQPYYEQALAIRRRMLGEKNAVTVSSLNNLGGLLQAMGDHAGARPYFERALAINRELMGEEHPATASSLTNLGGVLQALGDLSGARSYYERALEINHKVLGEEHPATATSLNKIGEILKVSGDYAGARPYFNRALMIRRQELGRDHPETAASLNSLGEVLQGIGDYAGARLYFEQALTIRRKALGDVHPETANSLNHLGGLFSAIGDQPKAQSYFEQAQKVIEQIQLEKQRKRATGFNLQAYSLRAKIVLAILFFVSFGIIGWQAFSRQGVSSTALYGLVPTANETSVLHLSDFFPGLASTPVRITAVTGTATPTWTPAPTLTSTIRIQTPTPIPTSTSLPTLIPPIKTPIPTVTPVPTNPPIPTNTPVLPTPVPQDTPTKTPFVPTTAPDNTNTPVPLPTQVPTDIPPTTVPPTTVPPTSNPTP